MGNKISKIIGDQWTDKEQVASSTSSKQSPSHEQTDSDRAAKANNNKPSLEKTGLISADTQGKELGSAISIWITICYHSYISCHGVSFNDNPCIVIT